MAMIVCLPSSPAFAETGRTIQVISATLGRNCEPTRADITAELHRQCDGQLFCPYAVQAPRRDLRRTSCHADLVAEWRCTPKEVHVATVRHVVDSTGTLMISCVEQTGPGH
jgi:hypothetical protein